MGRYVDIHDQRFGRLLVIEHAGRDTKGGVKWKCRCDCGNEAIVRGSRLREGRSKSCGCLWREKLVAHNGGSLHGFSNEKLYRVWSGMRARCRNPNDDHYRFYGAKGVLVCAQWDDYRVFRAWALTNGYKSGLTIERIDVFGNYESKNCEWIPLSEQSRNTRQKPRKRAPILEIGALSR